MFLSGVIRIIAIIIKMVVALWILSGSIVFGRVLVLIILVVVWFETFFVQGCAGVGWRCSCCGDSPSCRCG